jgi:hypothetical protein
MKPFGKLALDLTPARRDVSGRCALSGRGVREHVVDTRSDGFALVGARRGRICRAAEVASGVAGRVGHRAVESIRRE